jgi:hypothetical protein
MKVMPFIDVENQSLYSSDQTKQTLNLRNCTTPSNLHSLILKTNISIDHINLVYTIEMIKNNKEEFDICFICNFLKLP